jgi:hypothetical protein
MSICPEIGQSGDSLALLIQLICLIPISQTDRMDKVESNGSKNMLDDKEFQRLRFILAAKASFG